MRTGPCCRRPDERAPGSRTRSVHACQVLRPRRVVRALAIAHSDVLPSATQTASAPRNSFLSRLNGWPARTPADASPTSSRMPAHGLGPMWFAIPSSQGTCTPLLLAGLPAHLCQNDLATVRIERQISWTRGRDHAVSYLTSCTC